MAYHFADDNKVHFINDENYPKKKEVVTKELFSTKDVEVKNSTVRMTSTSAGILACYVFEPSRTSEPGYTFQDEFADIKTYDIKTGQELQTFKKLNAGIMFGRSFSPESHQPYQPHVGNMLVCPYPHDKSESDLFPPPPVQTTFYKYLHSKDRKLFLPTPWEFMEHPPWLRNHLVAVWWFQEAAVAVHWLRSVFSHQVRMLWWQLVQRLRCMLPIWPATSASKSTTWRLVKPETR